MGARTKVDALVVARVCVRHPEKRARLVCTRCHRWQCDQCARPLTEREGGPLGCALCAGVLRVGELDRPADSGEQLVWRMLTFEGGVTIVALSMPGFAMAFEGLVGAYFLFIYAGILATYYFQTVEHVGRQRPGLPFSARVMTFGGLIGILLRGFLTFGLCFGPAIVIALGSEGEVLGPVLAFLAGALLMPAAVLAGVVTHAPLNALWPIAWAQVIARAPRSYLRLLGWVYGSTFVWAVVTGILMWALEPVPTLRYFVMPLVHTSFAIWQAMLFGRFVQEETGSFGTVE